MAVFLWGGIKIIQKGKTSFTFNIDASTCNT